MIMDGRHARFAWYVDSKGEYRWSLLATNGLIIADSAEGYSSKRNVLRAIRTVRKAVDDPQVQVVKRKARAGS